jgi:hypothetical protein
MHLDRRQVMSVMHVNSALAVYIPFAVLSAALPQPDKRRGYTHSDVGISDVGTHTEAQLHARVGIACIKISLAGKCVSPGDRLSPGDRQESVCPRAILGFGLISEISFCNCCACCDCLLGYFCTMDAGALNMRRRLFPCVAVSTRSRSVADFGS